MKRWIIEYFDIFEMCNGVIIMSLDIQDDITVVREMTLIVSGVSVPVMGIREDGSIGGG